MKVNRFFSLSLIISLSFLSSCSLPNTSYTNNSETNNSSIKSKFSIQGKVEFPSFSVKATLQDIASGATVSLLYPPDHSDPAKRNTTIATGLTNQQGNFNINTDQGFTPVTNEIFLLDVIKRIGGPGNKILNLRTYLKWTGDQWKSITYPAITINRKTTALAIIAGLKADKLSSNEVIEKFPVVDGTTQVKPVNSFANEELINSVLAMVDESLTDNQDSIGSIRYDGKSNAFYKERKTDAENVFPLVFSSSRNSATNIFTMSSNGSDIKALTKNFDLNIDFYSPKFSPDKNKVAFVVDDFTKSNIYVVDKDGTNLKVVTNDETFFNSKPVWSPNGNFIAYNSVRTDNRLRIVNLQDLSVIESSIAISDLSWASWSPDGTKVLFTSAQDGDEEIYSMNANGTGLTKLTNNTFDDSSPKYSPDGNSILFVSNRSGNDDVFVMNSNGQSAVNISNTASNTETNPLWSPDGLRVLYQSEQGNQYDLFVSEKTGNNPQKLTNSPTDDYAAEWINNEDIIYTTEFDGNKEIFMVNTNTVNPLNISKNPKSDSLNSAFNFMD